MRSPLLRMFGSVCFMIVIAWGRLTAREPIVSAVNDEIRDEYYTLLKVGLTNPFVEQIDSLQCFIIRHPGFDGAYLKILERYIVHDQKTLAAAYFRKISAIPACRRNSNWMLAKLFIVQNDTSAALMAFEEALRCGPPSTILLKDFVECSRQLKTDERADLFRRTALKADAIKLFTAFYNAVDLRDDEAIGLFRELFHLFSDDVEILDTWGHCCFRLCRFAEAEDIWKLGLERSHLNSDLELEGRFLCNLGLLSARLVGQDRQARIYCDSASSIANRLDDWYLKQLIVGYSAIASTCRRDYSTAIKLYQKAIRLASRLGLDNELSTWYYRCGQALYFSRQYPEALTAYDQSDVYSRRANNWEIMFLAWLGKGDLYFNLEQYPLARLAFQSAYDLMEQRKWSNKRYQANACMRLADLLVQEKQYKSAIKLYRKTIDIQPWEGNFVESAYWLGQLANVYRLAGESGSAHITYLQAYETAKLAEAKQYMPWYLIKAAQIDVSEGNVNAAIQKCEIASGIDTSKNNRVLWVELYLTLGNAYKKLGNLSKAISFYSRAAETVEGTRQNISVEELRVGYFSTWHEVYRGLVQCFLQRYFKSGDRADLDSLFYYKEMSLGRGLRDMRLHDGTLASHSNNGEFDKEFAEACRQLRIMQRRIRQGADKSLSPAEWNHLFSQLEAARYSLVAQRLQALGRNSFVSKYQLPPTELVSTLLNNLQREELGLLLYHVSEQGSFVMIAANKAIQIVQLQVSPSTIAVDLDSLIAPFHQIGENERMLVPFRAGLAHELYQCLIKPAEEAVKLPKKLVIVPDLVLINLPFEMLLATAPDKPEYTQAEYPSYAQDLLLQHYTFVYSPSTALLRERSKPIKKDPNILILADPFGNTPKTTERAQFRSRTGWSFDSLPFSEVEAQRIVEDYPSTKVYTRATAKKAVFMREAPQQDILHLATHAFVDTTFDAFSGLVLAAGHDSTDDGMLMGYEIADMNLSCDLITLSACETGRGKPVVGEGILGLPRLFLGAGAKTVLMTLWKVDDRFASKLMPDFYDHLLNQRVSKAEALNEAKRFVLSKVQPESGVYYQHPFYWASFVLYGDPGMEQNSSFSYAGLITTLLVVLIIGLHLRTVQRNKRNPT